MREPRNDRFKKRGWHSKVMNEITSDNAMIFLKYLGFFLEDGKNDSLIKKFPKNKNYEIKIKLDKENFKKSKIDFGSDIKVNRETTSNFSQQENFVILECVIRLLNKGYSPDKIILEKDWKLGHREKGCLDINVLDEDDSSFLMIECKTWDKEYKKEKNKMYDNGGQLFSYYVQEKNTNCLCLYTSVFNGINIIYENSIVEINENIKNSTTNKEAFERWKPQVFENRGIFEDEIKPYNIEFSGLRKRNLKELTREDGGDIFNRFAEILRRNVVSDKTNAYNKIFNLFLCKIVDEYEKDNPEEKLDFQWEQGENNETVLLRLNDLYKRGMKDYLNLDISAVTLDQLEKKLDNIRTRKDKEIIRNLFIEQKLYTSNDFAFKEVFDKKTFDINCIVVKEVVKLLEPYKIRYETKQQFLGDFFEKLLNTGIKQEVGQFFTPVPIAQFICKSLPVFNIIKEKNSNKEINFLPYVIDYASGSGHFLTEMMAEINHYVEDKIDDNFIKGGTRAKNEFNSLKNNMLWAREYVYGIEKDYRLAKTTKIATFLNGDGDAQIICGDGLDNFEISEDYKGKLKINNNLNNEQFDIVVANPPYSVSGFKTTLRNGKESFDLFENMTDKSKEIECLFIERTKQLLKEGGVAGIVLPSSILSNTGIYTKTREIILQNFEIKGIVELGANTFMATGTNTIVLFLKRRTYDKNEIMGLLDKSIKQSTDLTINNIETPIKKYVELTKKGKFEDYMNTLKERDKDYLIEELQRIYYYILTYNQKVIVFNTPKDRSKEREFLGYEFSSRRGHEGINIFNLGGKLYNKDNLLDSQRLNYLILKNFTGELSQSENQNEEIKILNLNEMIDFHSDSFEKTININKKKEIAFKDDYSIEELQKRVNVKIGGTPSRRVKSYFEGNNLWVSIQQMNGTEILDTKEKLTDEAIKDSNVKLIKKGTTLLSFKLSIGKTAIAGKDLYTNEAIAGLEVKPDFKKEVLDKYLFYLFSSDLIKPLLAKNSNIFGTSLNKPFLEKIKIPFPDLRVQQNLVEEMDNIQSNEQEIKRLIDDKKEIIQNILSEAYKFDKHKLDKNIVEIYNGGTPDTENELYWNGDINWATLADTKSKYLYETKRKITDLGLTNSSAKKLPINTVLFSSRATIGDVSIAKVETCTNQGYKNFICNQEKIYHEYLYYILKVESKNIESLVSKMTYPEVSTKIISNYEVPLPPIKKQIEIVNKINIVEKEITINLQKIHELEEKKEKVISKYLLK